MNIKSPNKIGFFSMILLGVNSIVGTGIFLLPGQVTALAGRWSMLSYLFVIFLILSIVWCFSKCAGLFSRNGGSYLYAKEAFGDFVGFEIGLLRWFVGIITWAALAVGFITALGVFWPPANKEPFRTILALIIVNGLGTINIFGMRMLKHLNNIATLAKIIPLLVFIVVGFSYIDQSHFLHFDEREWQVDAFGSACLIVFFAFSGFENLPIAAGEMHNPRKNIPIAVFIVISICACLYCLIQFIAMGVLGSELLNSQTPILDSAEVMFGDMGKFLVGIAMLISIGGINIAASFITPRSGLALAEDRFLPPIMARRNRQGSPFFIICATSAATSIFVLTGSFAQLIAISVVCRFIQYFSTCMAIFVFHHRGTIRAFDSPWKAIFPIIGIAGISWLLYQASIWQVGMGIGVLLAGIPIYCLQKSALLPNAQEAVLCCTKTPAVEQS